MFDNVFTSIYILLQSLTYQFNADSEFYGKHQTMKHRYAIPTTICLLLIFVACNSQETAKKLSATPATDQETAAPKKQQPHRYGGWYCPDNFGFVPVDIYKLDEVPAIAGRLPTQQELQDHKSLISVDTEKYPDARALDMDLPRVARIHSGQNAMDELIIVIQAIIVNQDTVVGYRFPNGGNGSAWLSEVTFLSGDEVRGMGPQPFFYSQSVVKAPKEDIWKALTGTDYFKQLGDKFGEQDFFSSGWTAGSQAHLRRETDGERATGYIGTVFGNAYMHIDYDRDGLHYSEKLLLIENHEDKTTELFFASGPYPTDFKKQKSKWDRWVKTVQKASEGG